MAADKNKPGETPAKRKRDSRKFLSAIFTEIENNERLLIWTLPDKKSSFFSDTSEAADYAVLRSVDSDAYVGVGPRVDGLGPTRRGSSSDVTYVPAIAIDLDVAGVGHKKANLFESRERALEFLRTLPVPNSCLIWSGGGWQAWWIFKEPIRISSQDDRTQTERLSKGWNDFVKAQAWKIKKSVDSIWDLSRVLRIPGTVNHKDEQQRPVLLVELNDSRFNPTDFTEWATDVSTVSASLSGKIKLRSSANPPFDRMDLLRQVEEKFDDTWNRGRSDFTDQSPSAYDMSLANFGVAAGWEDQWIVDLLIAHRRKHGDPLKLREDYYTRTISKAKLSLDSEDTYASIDSIDPSSDSDRDKILQLLRHVTGAPIKRIVRHVGEDEEVYSIHTDDGQTHMVGGIDQLAKWKTWWNIAFRCRIHGAPSVQPKMSKWLKIVSSIHPVVEDEIVEGAGGTSLFISWIRDYTRNIVTLDDDDPEQAYDWVKMSKPYREDGFVFVNLTEFREWIRREKRERVTPVGLAYMMKASGMKKTGFKKKFRGREVYRRYWHVPEEEIE